MSYTRQKLLTLISVLLLSLFVGCANQDTQRPTADIDPVAQNCPRALQPNTNFVKRVSIAGVSYSDTYSTNQYGYPVGASFKIDARRANVSGPRPRGQVDCSTSSVGNFGGRDFQGGHMAADRFKAITARENLFPQRAVYNQGSFRDIEAAIARRAKQLQNKYIEVDIDLKYAGGQIVPWGMDIKLSVYRGSILNTRRSLVGQKKWYYANEAPDKRNRSGKTNREYNTDVRREIANWLSQQ